MNKIHIQNQFFDKDYLKIDFEWFTMCDKSCSYCYNVADGEKRTTQSTENIIKGFDNLLGMKHEKLILSLLGGEILLHKDFNKIINYVAKIKKPKQKFLLFTHGQHNPEIFKSKMSSVLKMKDSTRVIISMHLEDMNFDNFSENIKFINDNFKYCSIVVFPNKAFVQNKEYFDKLINDNTHITIEPLTFDYNYWMPKATAHHILDFNRLSKFLTPYNHRAAMKIFINNKQYSGIEGKYRINKEFDYLFEGWNCRMRVYEVRGNGDIYSACGIPGTFGNAFNNTSLELDETVKPQIIKCNIKKCEPNLCALEVWE